MSEIKSITDQESHAPRERVSWNFNSCAVTILQWCHAPRERVSWNRVVHGWAGQRLVTLHVSVWVEIEEEMLRVSMGESRSTWACELKWFVRGGMKPKDESRSTWACELKLYTIFSFWILNGHAPRVRVSWNSRVFNNEFISLCHAPRERVSWNVFAYNNSHYKACHAPRERVSWNILISPKCPSDSGHAPRERVSWNTGLSDEELNELGHAPRERVSWNV